MRRDGALRAPCRIVTGSRVLWPAPGGTLNPLLGPKIRPLHLSDAAKLELAAFLHSLSRSCRHFRSARDRSPTTQARRIPCPTTASRTLPDEQVDRYDRHQKKAFLEAFNSAYEEYDHDESRAFAVAHNAAKQAGDDSDG